MKKLREEEERLDFQIQTAKLFKRAMRLKTLDGLRHTPRESTLLKNYHKHTGEKERKLLQIREQIAIREFGTHHMAEAVAVQTVDLKTYDLDQLVATDLLLKMRVPLHKITVAGHAVHTKAKIALDFDRKYSPEESFTDGPTPCVYEPTSPPAFAVEDLTLENFTTPPGSPGDRYSFCPDRSVKFPKRIATPPTVSDGTPERDVDQTYLRYLQVFHPDLKMVACDEEHIYVQTKQYIPPL
jgi:hypothetical protein